MIITVYIAIAQYFFRMRSLFLCIQVYLFECETSKELKFMSYFSLYIGSISFILIYKLYILDVNFYVHGIICREHEHLHEILERVHCF